MEKYMEEKYLLIKTSILEVEEIKDNLCSKSVELTEEELKQLYRNEAITCWTPPQKLGMNGTISYEDTKLSKKIRRVLE